MTTGDVLRTLFALLILSCTYDKSGVTLSAGREISISYYKVGFYGFTALMLAGRFWQGLRAAGRIDRPLRNLLVVFVATQTTASLLGLVVAPGAVSLSSEVYYFTQRAHFLLIPVFALGCGMTPRTVLKLLIGAVVLHLAFVVLQFGSPNLYRAFAAAVADPRRIDVIAEWDGRLLSYFGLMRTGNYGAFVAAFGLLALAVRPSNVFTLAAKLAMAGAAILIAITGNSRATLVMVVVALMVYSARMGLFARWGVYAWALAALIAAAGVSMFYVPSIETLRSVYAFIDGNRVGSNQGKFLIFSYGMQLFARSPIVGYGQRRFADISEPLGNTLASTSEAHSQVLSVLLGSGVIGLGIQAVLTLAMLRRLWRPRSKDFVIVCGLFLGLNLFNILYDTGALDVFAVFNGVAAYYALTAKTQAPAVPT